MRHPAWVHAGARRSRDARAPVEERLPGDVAPPSPRGRGNRRHSTDSPPRGHQDVTSPSRGLGQPCDAAGWRGVRRRGRLPRERAERDVPGGVTLRGARVRQGTRTAAPWFALACDLLRCRLRRRRGRSRHPSIAARAPRDIVRAPRGDADVLSSLSHAGHAPTPRRRSCSMCASTPRRRAEEDVAYARPSRPPRTPQRRALPARHRRPVRRVAPHRRARRPRTRPR